MFDDIGYVPERQNVVHGDGVLPGVKRFILFIQLTCTTGKLGFIIGFKRNDIQSITLDGNRAGILCRDGQQLGDLATGHIDNRDGIFRRKSNIGFVITGKCNATL